MIAADVATVTKPTQTVADVIGTTVAAQGVEHAFGVLGSGNLVMTNALRSNGVRFHHARIEGGAICMADGYARVSGQVGICSVHQGPGLTNLMTGLTEAVKSRTPILVLAGETPAGARTSNFRIDQHELVESVGAIADRVHGPATAADDAQRAYERAVTNRRPVVLMAPIDIQAQPTATTEPTKPRLPHLPVPEPATEAIKRAADLLQEAKQPLIIAGRGAVLADAGTELEALGQTIGAIMATSAPANGLFAGLPYSVGISGGFASPAATVLLPQADVVLVVGASANDWTTKHGELISPTAKLVQIDIEAGAIARNRPADLAIVGDAKAGTRKLAQELEQRGHQNTGFRTPEFRQRIAANGWRDDPYEDEGSNEWIDPRTLSIALNEMLPQDKAVVIDSGHFMGYPAMFFEVTDPHAWVFVNGFQSVGLGLGNAIGAAIARPDRPTVAALGDGGAFMALAEIETAARLGLKLLVVIYDDAAYGAEVHHFAPLGHDVSGVQFPDADLAAIALAAGAQSQAVRSTLDLDVVKPWLNEPDPRPLVLDAKVNPTVCAEWLAEAFRTG